MDIPLYAAYQVRVWSSVAAKCARLDELTVSVRPCRLCQCEGCGAGDQPAQVKREAD